MADIGLAEGSEEKERVVVQGDTAIRYKVVEETIDIQALKDELAHRREVNRQIDQINAFRDSLLEEQKAFVIDMPYLDTLEIEELLSELEIENGDNL
jgi:hypothetical protein